MDIKEVYDGLSGKYDLPSFDDLNDIFEIEDIDNEHFILREIRRKVRDRIENYAKIFESVLQPEATMNDMHECKVFNDDKKKDIFEAYKKMIYVLRLSTEVSIDETDEKSCSFIKEAYGVWNEVKDVLKDTITELKNSWLVDSDIKEELGYMG